MSQSAQTSGCGDLPKNTNTTKSKTTESIVDALDTAITDARELGIQRRTSKVLRFCRRFHKLWLISCGCRWQYAEISTIRYNLPPKYIHWYYLSEITTMLWTAWANSAFGGGALRCLHSVYFWWEDPISLIGATSCRYLEISSFTRDWSRESSILWRFCCRRDIHFIGNGVYLWLDSIDRWFTTGNVPIWLPYAVLFILLIIGEFWRHGRQ